MDDKQLLEAALIAHGSQTRTNLALSKALIGLLKHLEIGPKSELAVLVKGFITEASKQANSTGELGEVIGRIIGDDAVNALTDRLSDHDEAKKHGE